MPFIAVRGGLRSLLLCALLGVASIVRAQYCPVGTTYFGPNYGLPGCSVGTCWSDSPFAGSTPVSILSGYPTTNYACAAPTASSGARENVLYEYDYNGNLVATTDPLGRGSTRAYDALSRAVRVTDAQAPVHGVTQLAYDAAGRTRSVTDPRSLQTTYTPNGFGETVRQVSPDSGEARTTFDAAGNVSSRLDANGVLALFRYDSLNRVTQITYSGAAVPTEVFNYEYDGGISGMPNALGRLTRIADATSITAWYYDVLGRVTRKVQAIGAVVLTTTYDYDASGQLQAMMLPSGQRVTYTHINRRVASIAVNGVVLLSGVGYEPFGPPSAWTWGNGARSFRDFDTDGRLVTWEFDAGAQKVATRVEWDVAGRVTTVGEVGNANAGSSYGYDAVDRLILAQPLPVGTPALRFGYDLLGNRTTSERGGVTSTYGYATNSNRLLSVTGGTSRAWTYDGAGNATSSGIFALTYSAANRLARAGAATYKVNALGQRVSKQVGAATTYFVYDETGHLLGEYDGTGAAIQETIWLEDLPVGTVRGNVQAGGSTVPQPVPPPVVAVNHAAKTNGGVARASSTYSPAYPVSAVNDGDRRGSVWGVGGGWNSVAGTNPRSDWVTVDFDGDKTLTEIDVYTLQDNYTAPDEPTAGTTFSRYGITGFEVQYWNGSGWQTVPGGSVTGNTSVWRKFVFPPIETPRIRVLVTATPDPYARIVEIEAWGSESARANYAASRNGGVASASSVAGAPYAVTGVNDGDRRGTGWNRDAGWNDGTPGAFPDWVRVDFDAPHAIDQVDVFTLQDAWTTPSEPDLGMTFAQFGATNFTVQYWNGTTWQAVPGGTVVGNDRVWRRFRFPAITTSGVRVQVDGGRDGTWSRITELEAWGPASGSRNVALAANGGVASASSVYGPAFAVTGVNDGDRAGHGWGLGAGWNDGTPGAFPDWVEVRFDGAKSISEVDVFTTQDDWRAPIEPRRDLTFSQYGITDFEVQYWNGSSFVAIPGASVTGNDKAWRQFRFPAIDTSRIRVWVTGAKDGQYSRIAELEAWGVPVNAAPPAQSSPALYYVHADHLATPRIVTRSVDDAIVWRWDNLEPFGANPANENPGGLGVFKYALRFPGQYYDEETGAHYNVFRDYAPDFGRYLQSDPLGVRAGPNTYAYVQGNPIRARDSLGLGPDCGSGWSAAFVPDFPFGFLFGPCCKAHDDCYDDCRRKPTRKSCDDDFHFCMVKQCQQHLTIGFLFVGYCSRLASVYANAVAEYGGSAFRDARSACDC